MEFHRDHEKDTHAREKTFVLNPETFKDLYAKKELKRKRTGKEDYMFE